MNGRKKERKRRSTLRGLARGGLRRADHGGDDVAGLVVAGIANLGVARNKREKR